MDLYKARLISAVVAFGLISGACLAAIMHYLVPALMISWNVYAIIVAYFIVFESLLVTWVDSSARKKNDKQLVRIYMLAKVLKVLLSLTIVLMYFLLVRSNVKEFAIIFIIFYLIFLFAESLLFVKIEKHYNIKK